MFKCYCSLFAKAPDALPLFGFPVDTDVDSPEVLNSARFKVKAALMVEMIGSALDMLGPDIELLSEILKDLGEKHARYGVTPQMFEVMGVALADMLEETVGKNAFNEVARRAFTDTFDILSGDMVIALKNSKK